MAGKSAGAQTQMHPVDFLTVLPFEDEATRSELIVVKEMQAELFGVKSVVWKPYPTDENLYVGLPACGFLVRRFVKITDNYMDLPIEDFVVERSGVFVRLVDLVMSGKGNPYLTNMAVNVLVPSEAVTEMDPRKSILNEEINWYGNINFKSAYGLL